MHVLLVNPNRTFAMHGGHSPSVGLPLGLLYVAASLERHNIPVSLFDCLIESETHVHRDGDTTRLGVDGEVLRDRLIAIRPGIVGISCQFTSQWDNALAVLQLVRTTLPETPIVLGGPHATVFGAEILVRHREVDFVIAGEGEFSFPRLVEAVAKGDSAAFAVIPGLMWRAEDGTFRANPLEPIRDLDVLPLPAYHLVDFERFFELQQQGLSTRSNNARSASIITSRGCPYTCTFCSIHLSMGRRWRAHSAEYTVDHIRHLVEQRGVRHLEIEDDNFTFRRERVNDICRRLVAERIPVTWDTPNGVRADTLDDELLTNMKASGCTGLVVAAESGDQDVVRRIVKKHLDLTDIERAAALAYKHGIEMGCFFVIGFPGETRRQIKKTLRFALRLYVRYQCHPKLNIATPLPGTELARIVDERGYLAREVSPAALARATAGTGSGQGLIRTTDFDPEYLRRLCVRFHRLRKLVHLRHLLTHFPELARFVERRWARLFRKPAYAGD